MIWKLWKNSCVVDIDKYVEYHAHLHLYAIQNKPLYCMDIQHGMHF